MSNAANCTYAKHLLDIVTEGETPAAAALPR
jgi:hypothetical protein